MLLLLNFAIINLNSEGEIEESKKGWSGTSCGGSSQAELDAGGGITNVSAEFFDCEGGDGLCLAWISSRAAGQRDRKNVYLTFHDI